MDKLFVVGEHLGEVSTGAIWDCVGVFDTEEKAVEACIKDNHFVGPLILNEAINDHLPWEGCYYPSEKG